MVESNTTAFFFFGTYEQIVTLSEENPNNDVNSARVELGSISLGIYGLFFSVFLQEIGPMT